jgi:hypothetical protein
LPRAFCVIPLVAVVTCESLLTPYDCSRAYATWVFDFTLESPISEKSDDRYVYLHKGYIPCTNTTRISTMASRFYWLRHGINVKMHNIPKTNKRSLLLLLIIGCFQTNTEKCVIKYVFPSNMHDVFTMSRLNTAG